MCGCLSPLVTVNAKDTALLGFGPHICFVHFAGSTCSSLPSVTFSNLVLDGFGPLDIVQQRMPAGLRYAPKLSKYIQGAQIPLRNSGWQSRAGRRFL